MASSSMPFKTLKNIENERVNCANISDDEEIHGKTPPKRALMKLLKADSDMDNTDVSVLDDAE